MQSVPVLILIKKYMYCDVLSDSDLHVKLTLHIFFVIAKQYYDPNEKLCCTNVLIKRRISNNSKCCNNTEIDSDTECCMGVPYTHLNQRCCGGELSSLYI